MDLQDMPRLYAEKQDASNLPQEQAGDQRSGRAAEAQQVRQHADRQDHPLHVHLPAANV